MNDVAKFIADKGFPEYAENFRKENVDGRLLAHLDEKALACLKIPKKERTEVLKCTSTKVPEFRLVSESLAADRFKRPVLGLIRSFVMKERRVWSVGSKGGRVHLKSTGVTVTLIENAVSKETNVSVTSYLPEDYAKTSTVACVATVLPHGLTLRKKAAIELRHHLCLEKPFTVKVLYRSGLSMCDEGYQLLADLNQEKRSAVDGETEIRVERNCIRILCLGFSEYCIVQEGYFFVSVRIYAPLAFLEGRSEVNVVASLSCQCHVVTEKIDQDQRALSGEPRECKEFQNNYISVDTTEKVKLSVDSPKDLYSVSGNSSYTIPATALKSLIGEDHVKCITRPFFLKRTTNTLDLIRINVSFEAIDRTGSTVESFSLYPIIWQPTPIQGTPNWLDEKVSSDERRHVATQIGEKWRHVGEVLMPEPRFTYDELDIFEEKSSNRNRAHAMLNEWAQRHHRNATRRMLIGALRRENKNALITEVFGCNPDALT